MEISEKLGEIYSTIEEKFFNLVNFFDEKGIPLNNLTNFLEEKGLPAFPAFVGVLLLLILLVAGLFMVSSGIDKPVVFQLYDNQGRALENVRISIYSAVDGIKLGELGEFSNGAKYTLTGRSPAEILLFKAEKDGFVTSQKELEINSKDPSSIRFVLENKESGSIAARIRLIDAASNQVISKEGLQAVATWGSGEFERSIKGIINEKGVVEFAGVPIGTEVEIRIVTDNYEQYVNNFTFDSEEPITISLAPIARLAGREVQLVLFFRDEENKPLNDVNLKIFTGDNASAHTNTFIGDGRYVTRITSGTSVRFVVTKDGYVSFESSDFETIRSDTEKTITLTRGGDSLKVSVTGTLGSLISQALVQLYNKDILQLINSDKTGFGGDVVFPGLDSEKTYYVTAVADGFLPERREINTKESEEIAIQLTAKTPENSANIKISVVGQDDLPAIGVSLEFFEIIEENELPLGYASSETDATGNYVSQFPIGKVIRIKAIKGGLVGQSDIAMKQGELNEVKIKLDLIKTAKIFRITDFSGECASGNIVIETLSGENLFDSESDESCRIIFDAKNSGTVRLTITREDGSNYTEEVNVLSGQEFDIKAAFGELTGLSPTVEFVGLQEVSGKAVEGIQPGDEYYAVFNVTFPGSFDGGMHVRIGKDDISNVESEAVGISGFLADPIDFFYGRTYNAFPSPGNEGIDFTNKGISGEFNKFIELYFSKPSGTKQIKIKLKAREQTTDDTLELHYRAWISTGKGIARTPNDEVLEGKPFSASRTSLYARTKIENLKVFEGRTTTCNKVLCVTYRFVTENRGTFEANEFKSVLNEVSALEMEIQASNPVEPKISVTSTRDPFTINLTGHDVRNFANFIDAQAEKTNIDITNLSLNKGESIRVRVYFKGLQVGTSSLFTQVVAGEEIEKQSFYFKVFEQKEMTARISPTNVTIGEDFSVFVEDSDGVGVRNATLRFKTQSGRVIKTVYGIGRNNEGLDGKYFVNNNLEPGVYKLEVSSEGYRYFDTTVTIGRANVIQIPRTIEIRIPKAAKKANTNVIITNTTDSTIEDITYEIKKPADFDSDFDVKITGHQNLPPNASGNANIKVEFKGDADARKDTEFILVVTGNIVGKYHTKSSSFVDLAYNQLLSDSCLVFSKRSASVTLLAESGNNASTTTPSTTPSANVGRSTQDLSTFGLGQSKRVEWTAKNNCGETINLNPEFSANNSLNFVSSKIRLLPGEEKPIVVNVASKVNFLGFLQRRFSPIIKFKADQFTKKFQLNVIVWSSRFAIAAPFNIDQPIAQREKGQRVTVNFPLYLQNIGFSDIEALDVEVDSKKRTGFQVDVLPRQAVSKLARGEVVFPPKILSVTSDVETSQDVQGHISVSGTIEGRKYVLRTIPFIFHLSAPNCISVSPNSFIFTSTEYSRGVESRRIEITNNCSEPVRMTTVTFPNMGQGSDPRISNRNVNRSSGVNVNASRNANNLSSIRNEFRLTAIQDQIVQKGQTKAFSLDLYKRFPYEGNPSIQFNGVLVLSQTPIRTDLMTTRIKLGDRAFGEGPVSTELELSVCEDETQKVLVKFPKIAQGSECETGYCDAEQMAEYIGKRLLETVRKTKSEVAKRKANAFYRGSGSASYRELEELRVEEAPFRVYLKNDVVSNELLEFILKSRDKYLPLKGFTVEYGDKQSYEAKRGTPYGNRIILESNNAGFKGCGEYHAVIRGAVPIDQTNHLDSEALLLYVKIEPAANGQVRRATNECKTEIQNFLNFMPIDKSLDIRRDKGTWLSTVHSVKIDDEDLVAVARRFAQILFRSTNPNSSSERRYTPSGRGNKLAVDVDSKNRVGDNLLLVEFDSPQDSVQAQKINVLIKASAKERIDQSILALEAGKAVESLTRNSLRRGCISKDKRTLKIKTIEADLENLSFKKNAESINVFRNRKICKTQEIKADLKTDFRLKIPSDFARELKEKVEVTIEEYIERTTGSGSTSTGTSTTNNTARSTVANTSGNTATNTSAGSSTTTRSPTANNDPNRTPKIYAKVLGGTSTTLSSIRESSFTFDTETEKQIVKVNVCVTGKENYALVLRGNNPTKFKVTINDKIDEAAKVLTVTLSADAANPYVGTKSAIEMSTLNQRTNQHKKTTKYAVFNWAGVSKSNNTEQIEFIQVGRKIIENDQVPNGFILILTDPELKVSTDGGIGNASTRNRQQIRESLRETALKGIGAYSAACVPVSVGCNMLLVGPGAFLAAAFDCGIPAAWAISSYYSAGAKSLQDAMSEQLSKIPIIGGLFKDSEIVSSVVNSQSRSVGGKTGEIVTEPGLLQNTRETMLVQGTAVGGFRQAILQVRGRKMTESMATWMSKGLAGDMVDNITVKKGFEVASATRNQLVGEIAEAYKTNLMSALGGQRVTTEAVDAVTKTIATDDTLLGKLTKSLLGSSNEIMHSARESKDVLKGLKSLGSSEVRQSLGITDDILRDTVLTRVKGATPNMAGDLFTNLSTTEAVDAAEQTGKKFIAKQLYAETVDSLGRQGIESIPTVMENRLKRDILSQLQNVSNLNPTTSRVRKATRPLSFTLPKSEADNIIKQAIGRNADSITEELLGRAGIMSGPGVTPVADQLFLSNNTDSGFKVSDDFLREVGESATNKGMANVGTELGENLTRQGANTASFWKRGRVRNWTSTKANAAKRGIKNFGVGMAKGLACGLAANGAGYLAWDALWGNIGIGPGENRLYFVVHNENGANIELERGKIYKFVKEKVSGQKNTFKVSVVEVPIGEKIPSNASWIEKQNNARRLNWDGTEPENQS